MKNMVDVILALTKARDAVEQMEVTLVDFTKVQTLHTLIIKALDDAMELDQMQKERDGE